MPYVFIRIAGPLVPQQIMTFPIKFGFGTEKIESMRLESYQAEGLASTTPILFGIRGQSQTPMYGNVTTSGFPLLFSTIPEDRVDLHNPIEIAGHSFLNGAAQIEMEIRSAVPGVAPIFSNLWLVFRVNYLRDPLYSRPTDQEFSFLQH